MCYTGGMPLPADLHLFPPKHLGHLPLIYDTLRRTVTGLRRLLVLLPCPPSIGSGSEFVQRPTLIMDVVDDVAEVGHRVERLCLCREGQGQERRITLGPSIGSAEQAVLAVHGHWAHGALGVVVVDVRRTDGEVALEAGP